jgi:hypothetical protein
MEARRNDYPFLALKSRPIWRVRDTKSLFKTHIRRFGPWGYMIRHLGVNLR